VFFCAACLLLAVGYCFALPDDLPKAQGTGPSVLVLAGGRPWVGNGFASMLSKSGCSVTGLSSVWLDGFGGASIKSFLTDLEEPTPKDGITPAFADLSRYKLVVITGMPQQKLELLYTPERIAALRQYVEAGGSLLLGNNTPQSLAELLPVIPGEFQKGHRKCKAKRPASSFFSSLPVEWKLPSPYRAVQLLPEARVLAPILGEDGIEKGILLAEKTIGQGKVIYFNDEWAYRKGVVQLCSWAYGGALMISTAAEALGMPLDAKSAIYHLTPPPERRRHDALRLKISPPELSLEEYPDAAKVSGREIAFGGDMRMAVDDTGSIAVHYPGLLAPLIKNLAPPTFTFSEGLVAIDDPSSEAVTVEQKGKAASVRWQLDSITTEGPLATLLYKGNEGNELAWHFKAGKLMLDGREFIGIAEAITMQKSNLLLESMNITFRVALPGAGRRVRRFACYNPPRGYREFDLSGERPVEVRYGGFFGDGQPFSWLVSEQGIFSDFVEKPCCISAHQKVGKGAADVENRLVVRFGHLKAPMSGEFIWHMYSSGAERGNNDWMAMYQFQRENLRRSVGLAAMAPEPLAAHQNTCNEEEIAASLAAARELGFHSYWLPWCPSPIEGLDRDSAKKRYAQVRSAGLIPVAWTAGDYSNGDSEKIFANKSWYIHDKDGKLFQYFGKHPVLDLSNPEFRAWYYGVMGRAVEGGLGGVYLDMYGAASGNVNFGTPESHVGIHTMPETFRFFQDKGVSVRIEGQNPLVLDTWWFRRQVYEPFTGREFALVGTAPGTHLVGDGFELDYFRMAMYNSFGIIHTDGYAIGFERVPGEIAAVRRIGALNPRLSRAREHVGFPFVRETPFGTSWISDKGGALFFYDRVSRMTLDLPENWAIEGHDGTELCNVPEETVLLLVNKNHVR
jgi:hypothetical protein